MAAQDGAGEDVYATILLSDTYLPGALVLAHSLRDAGTKKKLVVLVTPDTVSAEVITELKTIYDIVIPVDRIRTSQPENLQLMNRADLHSVFTKITLWKQTQFRKIVYIDSDVVAYRAPDELFELPHPFSAAPDIGWPDIFNTGVMALTPNLDDYKAMLAMAESNTSFDGADQGLINMHFGNNYNRLSFVYNVTPSAHYQYAPAYRHFQSTIAMVHFIGPDKPWFQGRQSSTSDSPYQQMIGQWWAVFDKHYGTYTSAASSTGTPSGPGLVQYFTKGEYRPNGQLQGPSFGSSWDAQRNPPPQNSRPEGHNLPSRTYEMSRDTTPYASSWYDRHREQYNLPKPIFPWEARRSPPARVFPEDYHHSRRESVVSVAESDVSGVETPTIAPSVTDGSTVDDMRSEPTTPTTPTTPTIHVMPPGHWSSFTLTNAWDEVPEIERYVDKIQKHQRKRSLKSPGPVVLREPGEGAEVAWRGQGSKIIEFPSPTERPSLPVTPAPIRPQFFKSRAHGNDDNPPLPAAAGVPEQTEWDPVIQLQKLKQQSEGFLLKLRNNDHNSIDLPFRHYSSEERTSPTYLAQPTNLLSPQPVKGGAGSTAIRSIESNLEAAPQTISARRGTSFHMAPPSYTGPGAVFEKGDFGDAPTQRIIADQHVPVRSRGVPEPSYAGPGPAFEKDADSSF